MDIRRILSAAVIAAGVLTIPWFAATADAAIARIAKFSGEVTIASGERLSPVTAPGMLLNDGDRVQTKQGEAEVLFVDGAVLRLNPFSNALLQERDEQGGFWLFKTSQAARRITCLVGKLFFQSGASDRKNYLQTPTAVAGIRGSSGDIGFDNIQSYLHMYTGEAAVLGSVIRGFFQNPGVAAADKNAVYQALVRAATVKQRADATGRAVDAAQAELTAVEVGRQVAQALQQNPDATVQLDAKLIERQTTALAAAASARISVEQIKESKADAEKAAADARRTGDMDKARQADLAALKAEQDRIAAERQAAAAQLAAEQANDAARRRDLEAAARAAQAAAEAAREAARLRQDAQRALQPVATSTPTTALPGVTTSAATTAPTTVPTTMPTSIPSSSTTSSTSSISSTTSSSTTTIVTPSR